jgi:glycosyltransferase involved in cell wall biosynthesis
MKKKLLINATRFSKKGTGVAVFTEYVVNQCSKLFEDVQLLLPAGEKNTFNLRTFSSPAWLSISKAYSGLRPIIWFLYATFFFPHNSNNVLSTTHHLVPGLKNQVITIHDLRLYYLPDTTLQRFYFHYVLPSFIHQLDAVLTVSQVTREEIHRLYNYPLEKIYTIPNCVDTNRFYPARTEFKASEPYLLAVGASWHPKNIHELLQNSSLWSDYKLKIVSSNGPYRSYLINLVSRLRISDRVVFLNDLSDFEMLELYQHAEALVYPSLIEGFGIPPLEAMACGIPVIMSRIDVFHEIYEDVPIYVDLGSSESWSHAFDQLKDEAFVQRTIQLGFLKATEFSEERMSSALFKAIATIWPDLEKMNFPTDGRQ